jgi:hypothetical protein
MLVASIGARHFARIGTLAESPRMTATARVGLRSPRNRAKACRYLPPEEARVRRLKSSARNAINRRKPLQTVENLDRAAGA